MDVLFITNIEAVVSKQKCSLTIKERDASGPGPLTRMFGAYKNLFFFTYLQNYNSYDTAWGL